MFCFLSNEYCKSSPKLVVTKFQIMSDRIKLIRGHFLFLIFPAADDVLLFFKHYDPVQKTLSCVCHLYTPLSTKFGKIIVVNLLIGFWPCIELEEVGKRRSRFHQPGQELITQAYWFFVITKYYFKRWSLYWPIDLQQASSDYRTQNCIHKQCAISSKTLVFAWTCATFSSFPGI